MLGQEHDDVLKTSYIYKSYFFRYKKCLHPDLNGIEVISDPGLDFGCSKMYEAQYP